MVGAVLWDLGGVLCHFRPERRVVAIARRCGASEDKVRAVLSGDLLERLDAGAASLGELLGEMQQCLGWSQGAEELGHAWARAFEPNIAVVELARRTAARSAVITNNGPPLSDHYAELLPVVAKALPTAFFSAKTRRVKPGNDAFLGACAALAVEPAHVLLVDDSEANIAAAAACGLHTHHFNGASALEETLHRADLLSDR